jgi:hypothetical protein
MFLTFVCIALNSHILFLNGYRSPSGVIKCYSTRSNPGYIYPQWERVHLVLYNLCPFAIMCTCNTYIIFVTVRSSRSQTETTPTVMHRKSIERYRQFTALLIIVTFAFVLLTLPACIYFVFFRNYLASKTQRNFRFMIQALLNSIQFTSHAINFFLYCFSAKSFRYEIQGMFRELFSNCRCKFRLSFDTTRQNGNMKRCRNNSTVLELQRLNYAREMQARRYIINPPPKFQLIKGKQPNWI